MTGFKSGGLFQTDSNQTESAQTDSDSVPVTVSRTTCLTPAPVAREYRSDILSRINSPDWPRHDCGNCPSTCRCNVTEEGAAIMMSIDDQLFDVSNKIRVAQFDSNIAGLAVLEPWMDQLLDAKHALMVEH